MFFHESILLIAIDRFRGPPCQCLRTHIRLSTFHMKVIFLAIMLTYRIMKPPWRSLPFRALTISNQGSYSSKFTQAFKEA